MAIDKTVKVLIVDDTEPLAELLQKLLDKEYGSTLEVFIAYSGDEALIVLEKEQDIDILISDLKMPGMDGISLLRKACKSYPDMLRILLSGYADMENLTSAINDCGIRNFIHKPWKTSQLYITIGSAINEIKLLRENARLQEENSKSFDELFFLLNDLVAELSPELSNYSRETAELCVKIAEELDINEEKIKDLKTAAMLHAISLLGMPQKIYKTHPSQLAGELRTMWTRYPEMSSEMLKSTPRLNDASKIIKNHGENVNGSGCLGLKGKALSLRARILRICSAYCASVFLRQADQKQTLMEMSRKSGVLYDKKCLGILLLILSRELGVVTYPLKVQDLKLGMKLGDNIYSKSKGVLLPKGTVINNLNLKRLRIYNEFSPVGEIYVLSENKGSEKE